MAFRLKPKEEKFFEFMTEHAKIARQSADLLQQAFKENADLEKVVEQMDVLEHKADDIVAQSMRKLHKTFITPFDREDIHALMEKQDDVVDGIKGIIERMHIYQVGPAPDGLQDFVQVMVKTIKQLDKALEDLDSIKKNHLKIEARCNRIIDLESKGDTLYRREMAALFRDGKDAIHIMKWKEILETMEEVLDLCEHLAESLKRIILKYA